MLSLDQIRNFSEAYAQALADALQLGGADGAYSIIFDKASGQFLSYHVGEGLAGDDVPLCITHDSAKAIVRDLGLDPEQSRTAADIFTRLVPVVANWPGAENLAAAVLSGEWYGSDAA